VGLAAKAKRGQSRNSVSRSWETYCLVHKDEVPSSVSIDLVESLEYTFSEGCDIRPRRLGIAQESAHTEVIRSDPHGIHRVVRCSVRVQGILTGRRIFVFCVRNEGRYFVSEHVWKWTIYAGEISEDHLVSAHCSRYSIVIELRAAVSGYISVPGDAAAGGVVALW
jgi:hypothetical protein